MFVSGDDILGIIDWETAEWCLAYWKYTTPWNVSPQNQFWRHEFDKCLQPMEKIRHKYFGDVESSLWEEGSPSPCVAVAEQNRAVIGCTLSMFLD
jgi:hypothetical protein